MNFAKMHGAGNDFLLFDGRETPSLETTLPALVPRLCEPRLGIGADGVLLLLPAGPSAVRLIYWNADGSEAAFCANGTRCAARFAAARWGISRVVLHTGFAAIPAETRGELVTLALPAPERVHLWRELETTLGSLRARYMIVGVPHLVVPVDWPDFWRHPLAPLAPELRLHPALPPGGANVNFVHVSDGALGVRSWERGVEGETLSCGSGDVAAALVALAEGWVEGQAAVRTASGRTLVVDPEGTPPSCPCHLTGPAEWVADGSLAPEWLSSVRS